ncbi:lipopolysaccharide-induced tumor necrosis factor-alpha factor homolog [Diadema antillarum]|uniref:lipopolysaccharide-induced tumor necrosis factor-alpha factor homolog n=1 Tax=Diadema antillarum TaxID=105358 RepID=UPI003A8436E7
MMDGSNPQQPPPPYPGDADKAYPPGGVPYPGQGAPYPPQGQAPAPYPVAQPAGYPPQGTAAYAQQPASYQQGGYPAGPPPPGHPAATVIVGQPTTTMVTTVVQHFGDLPTNTKCPNCQNQVTTVVSHEPGTMAWLICLLMFFFGLWLCCFIPFCVDSMQNANHHCPVCKYRIATYAR